MAPVLLDVLLKHVSMKPALSAMFDEQCTFPVQSFMPANIIYCNQPSV